VPFDVRKILGVLTFVAVPCLAILAYRGWARSLRQELPHWRNALGLASIVVTFLSWFSYMLSGIGQGYSSPADVRVIRA
jgi:hypothetical protein